MDKVQDFIVANGTSLESAGVNNYALSKAKALDLLNLLAEQKVVVLGGDVYISQDNQLLLTYDNWYSDKETSESEESFRRRSISESQRFISSYVNPGAYFAFTLDR